MIPILLLAVLAADPARAETIVAARTIPAQTIISETDLVRTDQIVPGAISDPELIVGREARIALYSGRPIREGDVTAPAVVDRNEIIPLIFQGGALLISTEGRALERASPGERIRVMNVSSRNTVTARIAEDGAAYVALE